MNAAKETLIMPIYQTDYYTSLKINFINLNQH